MVPFGCYKKSGWIKVGSGWVWVGSGFNPNNQTTRFDLVILYPNYSNLPIIILKLKNT